MTTTGAKRPGPRILVVEDSPTQAERVRLVLEEEGYVVELARNGREALEKLAVVADMVISDVLMPEMDGFALCRAVKADPRLRGIPFVLLTSQRTPGDILRGLELGADNFVTKPFEDAYLLERVARIFDNLARRQKGGLDMELTVRVAGREIVVNADKEQMIELLFSTSDDLSQSNQELEETRHQLEQQARNLERMIEERTLELRVAEERYRQLVEQMPAVVYLAEPESPGRFLYISPQAEVLLGHPASEWLADAGLLARSLHADDRGRVLQLFQGGDAAGGSGRAEFRMLHRDGHVVWVEAATRLVHPAHGGEACIQGFLVDISERRRLEEELQRSTRMEAVGRLAGGVAHDFNNLLGVITGFSDLAARQLPAEHPVHGRLAQIVRASQRAADLTRQLLAFSRRQVMQPKVMDLGTLLGEVQTMLRRLIGEDIELVFRVDPGAHRVEADPTQLEQVIMNLAINARDAMPGGGVLRLEASDVELDAHYFEERVAGQPGPYVMLTVSDTGTGMDVQTQARIFEPFFTTKAEGKGTGLGLATVYGIVKQSGGFIWVYSEPGHGTVFKVYLPRVETATIPEQARAPQAEPPRGTETILVVEDQEGLRDLIQEMLELQGYTVLSAADGEGALALAAEHAGEIDLLLTDVVMPRMNGRELAEKLVTLRPALRALYMSGYTNGTITERGILMEGASLLEKPFTQEGLSRAVRAALHGKPG